MSYENKDNILLHFSSVHDEEERLELEEVYHYAEEWHKLSDKISKVRDKIKSKKNQDVMSAVSAGVLSGIINYMAKADEEREGEIENE